MQPFGHRRVSRHAVALAFMLGAGANFAAPAHAGEYDTLRIASWGLAGLWHVPGEALRSEAGRRVTPTLARDAFRSLRDQAEALDADIVTLQGVGSPQAVQRVFPARDYFLIFSRQLLERYSEDRRALNDPRFRQSYTAIVVRRDRSLRVLARVHVSTLAVARAGSNGPSTTPAGLAVKILVDGHEFWTLAVDLTTSCEAATVGPAVGELPAVTPVATVGGGGVQPVAAPTATCKRLEEQAVALAQWIGRKQADGEHVIVAGSFVEGVAVASADQEVRQLWSALGGATSPARDDGPPMLAPLRGTRPVRVTEAELALIGVGATERRQQMRISRQFGYDQTRSLRKRRSSRLSPGTAPLEEPAAPLATEDAAATAENNSSGQGDGSVASLVFDAFRAFISASRVPSKSKSKPEPASKPAGEPAAVPPADDAKPGDASVAAARTEGGKAEESPLSEDAGHPTLAILPRGPVPAGCESGRGMVGGAAQPDGNAGIADAGRTTRSREYLLVDRALFSTVETVAQGHLSWNGSQDDPRRAAARGCPVFIDLPLGS